MFFSFLGHVFAWFLVIFVLVSWANRGARKAVDHAAQKERDEAATLRELAIREYNRTRGPAWVRDDLDTKA